jgi:hypothetical protein
MSEPAATLDSALRALLTRGVTGTGAHVDPARVLDGLDWTLAGRLPEGSPHTIQQLAHHIIFWNGFCVATLEGASPSRPPDDQDSWPGPRAPGSAAEWELLARAYRESLSRLRLAIERAPLEAAPAPGEKGSRLDGLRANLQHTSYHIGQIALLRRMLGAWPPPGGGDTG